MIRTILSTFAATSLILIGIGLANAMQSPPEETERIITEKEVPNAALDAFKKIAANFVITEYAEEKENGKTYYEASWKGIHGNTDAVVTPEGYLMAIEESVDPELVPNTVRSAAVKAIGKQSKMSYEKKTVTIYEVHYTKGDKPSEMMFTPDGLVYEEPIPGKIKQTEKDSDEKD